MSNCQNVANEIFQDYNNLLIPKSLFKIVLYSNPSEGRTVPAAWPQYNNGSKMMCRLTQYMSRSSMERESEDLLRRYRFWSETMKLPRDQDEEDIRPLQEFSKLQYQISTLDQ